MSQVDHEKCKTVSPLKKVQLEIAKLYNNNNIIIIYDYMKIVM